jgi:hypothetical protein
MISNAMQLYKDIIETMVKLFNEGKYIDNEHAMSKFIPRDQLVEIETVGLMGNIAPNGMMIID